MDESTFTHKDLADKLGVSETTIKSYRRKFPGCFPVSSRGKPIRFSSEAVNIALRIKDMFASGMSVEEITKRLNDEFDFFPSNGSADKVKQGVKGSISHDFTDSIGRTLSNMAKSIITIHQQQNSILEGMKNIENMILNYSYILDSQKLLLHNIDIIKNFIIKENKLVNKDANEEKVKTESPRHLLYLPLVIKNNDGSYCSVGGINFSKSISLNDIKAMLAHCYKSPDNFTLTWTMLNDFWWVSFSQEKKDGLKISIQINEIFSGRGVSVAEVYSYLYNDNKCNPMELIDFIAKLKDN